MFAIMPPEDLAHRIQTERVRFSENYNCFKGLKPPVHITLFEPFTLDERIDDDQGNIEKLIKQQLPFKIELHNYAFFENHVNPVVYINVVKNPALSELRKKFVAQITDDLPVDKSNSAYKPHFTIGYRDIPKAIFPRVMTDYSKRKFEGSFMLDRVFLWLHDSGNWQVDKEFLFNTGPQPVQAALF